MYIYLLLLLLLMCFIDPSIYSYHRHSFTPNMDQREQLNSPHGYLGAVMVDVNTCTQVYTRTKQNKLSSNLDVESNYVGGIIWNSKHWKRERGGRTVPLTFQVGGQEVSTVTISQSELQAAKLGLHTQLLFFGRTLHRWSALIHFDIHSEGVMIHRETRRVR